ncbi:DNA-3-methyladenine glycosylase [Haloferula sargassicola]|uniref:Putative 3-methyladenine DNA glycosylase n=1 Tax=Haloferula sargassicola TaxID=490096 RepID=A0ABP9UIX8_9BACT
MGDSLTARFFENSAIQCARDLIGAEFFWGGCHGRIVETEAYLEHGDPACHTFSRPSAREFVARHPAGTAYVYLNYGVHWLFNVLTKDSGGAGFVLFRAIQPLGGLELMQERRHTRREIQLCSGPGKLCQAFGIRSDAHAKKFLGGPGKGIRPRTGPVKIAAGARIGISRGSEFPWRFAERNSPYLSKPLI